MFATMFNLTFLYIPLILLLVIVVFWLYPLKVYYDAARASGIPLVVLPFDSANPLWMLLDRPVTFFFARFPIFKGSSFTRFNPPPL